MQMLFLKIRMVKIGQRYCRNKMFLHKIHYKQRPVSFAIVCLNDLCFSLPVVAEFSIHLHEHSARQV